MASDRGHRRITIHSFDEIPAFASYKEEAAWWDTHRLSDELWREAEAMHDPEDDALIERIRQRRAQQRRTTAG